MSYRTGLGSNRRGLGIVPAVAAAAIPQAESLVRQALSALVSIIDPGKKRDAYREQRAEIYYQLANAGSVTAARILHGGSVLQYTPKERQYYVDRWAKLTSAHPDIASAALAAEQAAGQPMGVPEPGSDAAPSIPTSVLQGYQNEINAYHASQGTPTPGYTVPASTSPLSPQQAGVASLTGNKTLLLGLIGAGLFLAWPKPRRSKR
jgi:hypothetical protein